MRVIFAILLSCVLSLSFFLYADEVLSYSAGIVEQNTAKQTIINHLKSMNYYKSEYKDTRLNYRIAVLKFQSDNNILADGVAGKEFTAVMKERLQLGKKYVYKDHIESPPSTQHWIAVNKSKRTLTLYWNKTAIKKYPVALGKANFVTPAGKFKIKVKVVDPAWSGAGFAKPVKGGDKKNPLGYRWLGLNIGKKDWYGIHGNNNPYSIGRNVSRGCVRMLNPDVEELYTYVKKGTPVWIGTDKVLRKWGVHQNRK